jgi:NNP family nitrate/nitrite transporter-like MFS transporter
MALRNFRSSGDLPTLISALLYFAAGSIARTVLSPTIVYIGRSLHLGTQARFELVSLPVLAAAVFRLVLGALADRIGDTRTALIGQIVVIAAIAHSWLAGFSSEHDVQVFAIAIGVAGGAFAVALPQVSRWYPARYQGLAMGIVGLGYAGVVLNALLTPWVAERLGWQSAFGVMLVPLILVFVVYLFFAKDAPRPRQPIALADYAALLADADAWRFMLFYLITFGGFVGLVSAAPLFFAEQYHVSGAAAGALASIALLCGFGFRPLGGHLADRLGGGRILMAVFAFVALAYLGMAFLSKGAAPGWGLDEEAVWSLATMPPITWAAVAVMAGGALALGLGNGAVFQLIPQRFQREIGLMTGLVGSAGGLGGFLLARGLGWSVLLTGDFRDGFLILGTFALLGVVGLQTARLRWRTTWGVGAEARL